MKENDVIHVKGCGSYWLYEKRNGIRGFRLSDTNFDAVVMLLSRGKYPSRVFDIDGFRQHNPELSDFLERRGSFELLPSNNM